MIRSIVDGVIAAAIFTVGLLVLGRLDMKSSVFGLVFGVLVGLASARRRGADRTDDGRSQSR
jgi:hypothetical protein